MVWTMAILIAVAIGACTIWVPLILLGIAATSEEAEREILRIDLPPKRTLARALLRRTRDPLIEDRARKWRMGE